MPKRKNAEWKAEKLKSYRAWKRQRLAPYYTRRRAAMRQKREKLAEIMTRKHH